MICSMEHQGTSGMKSGPQESTVCIVSAIGINIMLCVGSPLLNKNGNVTREWGRLVLIGFCISRVFLRTNPQACVTNVFYG